MILYNKLSITLLIKIYILFLCNQKSEQADDEKKLYDYLFLPNVNGSVYNPYLRPVNDSNLAVNVEARLGIKRIFEMDESNHRVVLFAVLFQKWVDQLLKWNPKDFGGIEYTYVDYSKIWTPQLQLVSKYANEKSSPSDNSIHDIYDNFPVKLSWNGTVQFTPAVHLSSECLFNYGRFPFDIQVCLFLFQMPYDIKQIRLKFLTYYTSDENKKYEHIWDIEDTNVIQSIDQDKNPVSVLQIRFKRKLRNYLYTLPSYIVYILTLLMFMLPQTSNQRIIIGSTCLIISTLSTYMMSNSLPHSDMSAWPLLGKMYLFNIILLTFSLVFSAFIINIAHVDHAKSVPDWLRKFTTAVLAKVFCIQAVAYTVFNSYSFKVHDDETIAVHEHINNQLVMSPLDPDTIIRHRETNSTSNENHKSDNQQSDHQQQSNKSLNMTKLLKKIHDHMEQVRYRLQRETYKMCTNNEWLLVGTLVDKILFFLYCSIVIFCTLTIFRSN